MGTTLLIALLGLLVAPVVICIPYELWALTTKKKPVITAALRYAAKTYPGPAVVIGMTYGFLWGILIGHLFLVQF
jgi:hypothetical protein